MKTEMQVTVDGVTAKLEVELTQPHTLRLFKLERVKPGDDAPAGVDEYWRDVALDNMEAQFTLVNFIVATSTLVTLLKYTNANKGDVAANQNRARVADLRRLEPVFECGYCLASCDRIDDVPCTNCGRSDKRTRR